VVLMVLPVPVVLRVPTVLTFLRVRMVLTVLPVPMVLTVLGAPVVLRVAAPMIPGAARGLRRSWPGRSSRLVLPHPSLPGQASCVSYWAWESG
jgi:hypothetical protein